MNYNIKKHTFDETIIVIHVSIAETYISQKEGNS